MLIICYYIVVRYLGYGASLLDCLVFVGFNLRGLSIFWPVGGIGWGGAFFKYLEFGLTLCDVDYLEGRNNHIFEDLVLFWE